MRQQVHRSRIIPHAVHANAGMDIPCQNADAADLGHTALGVGCTAVLGLVWGSPLMRVMVRDGDFPFHLQAAAEFAATGLVTVPHFLLQVLLGSILALGIFPSAPEAALVFFGSLYALTAAITCWYIGRGGLSSAGV